MQPIRFKTTEEQRTEARAEADRREARARGRGYRRPLAGEEKKRQTGFEASHSDWIGTLAEECLAENVPKWVRHAVDRPDGGVDFTLGRLTIDVKTSKYGANFCLLKAPVRAHIIVFCVAPPDGREIKIAGWFFGAQAEAISTKKGLKFDLREDFLAVPVSRMNAAHTCPGLVQSG